MKPSDDQQSGIEAAGEEVPRTWEAFQRFAANVEEAEREGILDLCHELVGKAVLDQLLAGHGFDADFEHVDSKRRFAALYVLFFFHEVTERTFVRCTLLAAMDKDIDVRKLAIELLGRFEEPFVAKAVSFLLAIILNDQEDTELRLHAYRSLVYLSQGISRVRLPVHLARTLDDIDWAYVASFPRGI